MSEAIAHLLMVAGAAFGLGILFTVGMMYILRRTSVQGLVLPGNNECQGLEHRVSAMLAQGRGGADGLKPHDSACLGWLGLGLLIRNGLTILAVVHLFGYLLSAFHPLLSLG